VRRGDLVQDGPGVKLPRVAQAVLPAYPPAAERFKRETTVAFEVLVDETGKVLQVRITKSDPSKLGFNEAATRAARETGFEPATKDGVPVKMWFPLTFDFTPR
jgi:TonB family protein